MGFLQALSVRNTRELLGSNRNDVSFVAVTMVIVHTVVFLATDVFEEHTASIFRTDYFKAYNNSGK